MQYKENAEVVTSDGRLVGRIDRVVIDPRSNEVTHLVVKKGLIFTQDKVLPVDLIEKATENQVVLKKGAERPEDLPDFVEVEYVPIEETGRPPHPGTVYASPMAWYGPSPGVAWWGAYPGYPIPPYIARDEQVNIPEGTVAVEEGAKVTSSDGKDLGEVERIFTDPADHRATHIVITKGLLLKEKKLIPTAWIDSISENEITLGVWARFIEKLPPYAD